MNTRVHTLATRLEQDPRDRLAWQQLKREIKKEPEEALCLLLFAHLSDTGSGSSVVKLLTEHWSDIFSEMISFYHVFINRTREYGDIWGGGKEFWFALQFLEVWSRRIDTSLSSRQKISLEEVLAKSRSLARLQSEAPIGSGVELPFLAQEVAFNLELYLQPAEILADYPQFRHMYFLPAEILPLALELENYQLSPLSERYFDSLLHETRRKAFRSNLLYFAQTFPLVLQAKWAYAVYVSLERCRWAKHPFVRRLLANSYWEARASGQIAAQNGVYAAAVLEAADVSPIGTLNGCPEQ